MICCCIFFFSLRPPISAHALPAMPPATDAASTLPPPSIRNPPHPRFQDRGFNFAAVRHRHSGAAKPRGGATPRGPHIYASWPGMGFIAMFRYPEMCDGLLVELESENPNREHSSSGSSGSNLPLFFSFAFSFFLVPVLVFLSLNSSWCFSVRSCENSAQGD